jgi:hypothetical protein
VLFDYDTAPPPLGLFGAFVFLVPDRGEAAVSANDHFLLSEPAIWDGAM